MAGTRRRLIVCVLCVALVGSVWAGVAFVRALIDVPRRAYAVWWTADLVRMTRKEILLGGPLLNFDCLTEFLSSRSLDFSGVTQSAGWSRKRPFS